jgi:hypothetical protein
MIKKAMRIRSVIGLVSLTLVVTAAASCGDVVRGSRSPVMLIVNKLEGAPGGATAGIAGNPLASSVITVVTSPAPCTTIAPCRMIFNDVGSVEFGVVMKDATVAPTTNNSVTIERYHVEYRRGDGRNQPGVDVPYPFDGAFTLTVPAGATGSSGFDIVRNVAKMESPLVELNYNPGVINTITNVTFYGHDSVGNDVSATASMTINFGNLAIGG